VDPGPAKVPGGTRGQAETPSRALVKETQKAGRSMPKKPQPEMPGQSPKNQEKTGSDDSGGAPLPAPKSEPEASVTEPEWKALHERACALGQQFYTDPASGLLVATRERLLQRGFCCHCGCRHCPYRAA
jgi:hypothetical protein